MLALEYFGGAPCMIVPDQTRSLIKNPCSYDPQNNRLYEEFAAHYGCALLAARPAHPRDKPKVENAVLVGYKPGAEESSDVAGKRGCRATRKK